MAEKQQVATIGVYSDQKSITVRLDPQGDEATGDDVVHALHALADTIQNKIDALRFAAGS